MAPGHSIHRTGATCQESGGVEEDRKRSAELVRLRRAQAFNESQSKTKPKFIVMLMGVAAKIQAADSLNHDDLLAV